jgi:hypothetical protein
VTKEGLVWVEFLRDGVPAHDRQAFGPYLSAQVVGCEIIVLDRDSSIFRLAVSLAGLWTVCGLEGMEFDSVSFFGAALAGGLE